VNFGSLFLFVFGLARDRRNRSKAGSDWQLFCHAEPA